MNATIPRRRFICWIEFEERTHHRLDWNVTSDGLSVLDGIMTDGKYGCDGVNAILQNMANHWQAGDRKELQTLASLNVYFNPLKLCDAF